MRSFDSFVSRRKITDLKRWLQASNIRTLEAFLQFCKNEELSASPARAKEVEIILAGPSGLKITPQKTKRAKEAVKKDSGEAWHVPAAERPISKPAKPATKRTPRRRSKQKPKA